jgi:hypothetical protein
MPSSETISAFRGFLDDLVGISLWIVREETNRSHVQDHNL